MQKLRNDIELDTEELSASLKCQKILLEAGSDPTLPNSASYGSSFSLNALELGSIVGACSTLGRKVLNHEQGNSLFIPRSIQPLHRP